MGVAAMARELARVRALAARRQETAKDEPASHRWLRFLSAVAAVPGAPAHLAEAAGVLDGYVRAGRVGAHTEYRCSGQRIVFCAWLTAKPGDPWYGAPMPVGPDEPQALLRCIRTDFRHLVEG
jgi:hypothetical protein